MSHFTVIVFGDDYTEQLQPYCENDEWFRPETDELPASKWDWYAIGGRWTGYFRLREGATALAVGEPGLMTERAKPGYADVCTIGDVDIEAMRQEKGDRAADRWDRYWLVVNGTPTPEPWASLTARVDAGEFDITQARDLYWAQPRLVACSEHGRIAREEQRHDESILGFSGSLEDYADSREEEIQRARDAALAPFAFVREGAWVEKGEMGWFGMAHHEADDAAWCRAFNELWDSLPDNLVVTLVDCHV